MKKFFLIPLMAMLCTVMTMATVRTAGTFAELQSAISAAANGDEIKLTADIAYPKNGEGLINITKSITLDGQGHKISGYGDNGGRPNVISINNNNTSYVTVELKNLNIYSTQYRPLETRGYITKLTLDNVNITSTGGSSNPQGLTIGGTQTSAPYAQLVIKDSKISVGNSGYPVLFWNPTVVTATGSVFEGYCALYFKDDSYGSSVDADACNFDAPNVHSGASNAFAVFALETTNLTFNLNNCGMNAQKIGDQSQDVFSLSEWAPLSRRGGDITINFTGDNTHFSTTSQFIGNTYYYAQVDGTWTLITNDNKDEFNFGGNLTVNFKGGTYSVDPREIAYYKTFYWDEESLEAETGGVTIPDGYEVSEVKQGDVTLYRVVKKAEEKTPGVMYDLNDFVPVEGEGYGDNPVSSFDLSTGEEMTLNQETTTAGYVQIKDHATEGATTVIVDKTAGGDEQRLIINNGLDVQGKSSVEVKPGAAIVIGEGGINTEKPENIVIESTEEAQGALLLDPTITVNQNPKLTVKLKTNSKLNQKVTPTRWEYTYQRFAIPVMLATAGYVTNDFDEETHEFFDDEEKKAGFESYVWQWTGSKWETTTWNTLESSIGYQLANNSKNGKVTYTFTGNLIGNTNTDYEFDMKGFKFFGNSYTAPIMIEELLNGFKATYPDVEATVWVYNYDNHGWKPVDLDAITDGFDDVPTTIKSMDGFILNLRSANSGVAGVDYASAIWNNPTINPKASASPAPRRSSASAISNSVVVKVSAANFADDVTLVEREDRDLSFENGADASKFMNESGLNIYAETPAGTLSRVATNDLLGTQITFDAINDEIYTLSFSHVRGGSYALRDNVTGKVIDLIEGETYTFTQAANTSVQNRFEIVASHKMPTAVDNIEASAKAKGIYTILGQYMGETSKWNSLPAGVYVVDGVKVVK